LHIIFKCHFLFQFIQIQPSEQQGQGDRYGRSGKPANVFSFRTADFLSSAQTTNAQYEQLGQTYQSAALAAQQLAPTSSGFGQWQPPVSGAAYDYGHGNPSAKVYIPFQSTTPDTSKGTKSSSAYPGTSSSSKHDREGYERSK
jgi:hypothetical protein